MSLLENRLTQDILPVKRRFCGWRENKDVGRTSSSRPGLRTQATRSTSALATIAYGF